MSHIKYLAQQIKDLGPEGQEELWVELLRQGVLPNKMTPKMAYTKAVELGGSDLLRAVTSKDAHLACRYAENVDKGPHAVTREGASTVPMNALYYARIVDKGPHLTTRLGAIGDPQTCLDYAQQIDRGKPHDLTRKGVLTSHYHAYHYAVWIDKGPHPETWEAVKHTTWSMSYPGREEVQQRWGGQDFIYTDELGNEVL